MPLESSIQKTGRDVLRGRGCVIYRAGLDGWPDDLVLYAPGRHFWIEWKNENGSLTAAQKIRIPRMQKMGEPVYVEDSAEGALRALFIERRKL